MVGVDEIYGGRRGGYNVQWQERMKCVVVVQKDGAYRWKRSWDVQWEEGLECTVGEEVGINSNEGLWNVQGDEELECSVNRGWNEQ